MSAMICSLLFLCFFLQANAFLKEKEQTRSQNRSFSQQFTESGIVNYICGRGTEAGR